MRNFIIMEQVHGNRVAIVKSSHNGKIIKKCDGMITNDPKAVLTVHAADCLPIFFCSPTNSSIGVLHAGWRGLEKEIIKNMIKRFSEFKIKSNNLLVFIGPHICQKHYEIKEDVAQKFLKYKGAIKKENKKIFLSLEKVAINQLVSLGVREKNINVSHDCTFENKNLDSFRRKDTTRGTRYAYKCN